MFVALGHERHPSALWGIGMTRVMLDSNLWRYVADANAGHVLEQRATNAGVEIAVVPMLVAEARGLKDDATRRAILGLLARETWTRLMPEAFLESQEIKDVIRRHRPQWMITLPDLSEQQVLEFDWQRSLGGFWSRAASDTPPLETDESQRGDREHALARVESQLIRKQVVARKETLPPEFNLRSACGVPPESVPGLTRDPVEYWRVPSLYHLKAELGVYASPYREWLDAEINVATISESPESLARLWYYEVESRELPRQWIRGCFEFLQAHHRATSGNPVDSALGSHLVDVDAVLSADRNFVRFANTCCRDATFQMAQAQLVSGGTDAVQDLLRVLETLR